MKQPGGKTPAQRGTKKSITIMPPNWYQLLVHPSELRLKNMVPSWLSRKSKPLTFSETGTNNMSKPPKMICETKFGSHLYGTATASSDVDYKGIFMPTLEEVMLGRIPKTFHDGGRDDTQKNSPGQIDVEYYSLHHFLRLATQGQTVAIDMLFTPEKMVYKDPAYGWIWDKIIENRSHFLSKQMNAFVGYARGQATKYSLKGERLGKLEAFYDLVKASSDASEGNDSLMTIWDQLPKDDQRENHQGVREVQIAGKWFGSTTRVGYIEDALRSTMKRYGKRAKAAAEADGVDWKALSYAVRVSKELIELLTFGKVNFPLADAPLLLEIKKGERSLEEVQNMLDRDLKFIEVKAKTSFLPDEVDTKWCDVFLVDIMKEYIWSRRNA